MRKVALVTGAGKRRIGWHVVQSLAERGYAMAIHYHTSVDEATETVTELEGRGVEAMAVGGDLAHESDVRRIVAESLGHFGRLNVLVNAAALWKAKPLEQVTADDVRAHFEINALGTFLCCQHVGLAMVAQAEGGAIVNIGDWAEARPYLNYAAYFPSKGAVTTITRSMAVELASRNPRVRVNCVLPGPVMLPPDLPAAQRQAAINGTLVKREGSPANVALAVLHFIENDFVTGTCLPVDGGRTIYAAGEER
ncbi:MAG TPA: SDR family oxidoreductase [Pirellulales bacterium]|jgi:pteridine reductase|nr:SDR family oxidoreductase [Pirellulales bacterium]